MTLLGFWIASSFLPALIWAAVIAVAIDPIHLRIRRRVGERHRTALAAVIAVLIALLVLAPLTLGVTQAAREAGDAAAWLANARTYGVPVPPWVGQLPFGSAAVGDWWRQNLTTPEAATQQIHALHGSAWLAHTRLIGTNVLHRLVTFAFTLLALFFILRDREAIIAQSREVAERLLGPAGERIGRQAVRSVRGTIDGLVLVGIGEGAVMAIVYLVLGVPHPLLLGAATAVAAMIPFGAALVFAIGAFLLLIQGAAVAAIVLVVIGFVVVGIADHFIRPVLIGGATRLPFLWVLIGILGGVETLGLLGLFIGPATMAILVMMWRDYLDDIRASRRAGG